MNIDTGKLSSVFPYGCTKENREELQAELFKLNGNYSHWGKWSDSAKQLDKEMSALGMLESCYAYGGISTFYTYHEPWEYCGEGSHYEHYLEKFEKVGGTKEEFDKMIDIQSRYLTEKCKIISAGYDSDGISYNSIVPKEV